MRHNSTAGILFLFLVFLAYLSVTAIAASENPTESNGDNSYIISEEERYELVEYLKSPVKSHGKRSDKIMYVRVYKDTVTNEVYQLVETYGDGVGWSPMWDSENNHIMSYDRYMEIYHKN